MSSTRKRLLVCIIFAALSTPSPGRGKAIFEVICKTVLGVDGTAVLKAIEQSESANQHAKASLNPKSQSFRGSFTGVLANESGRKVKFADNPVFEEALTAEFGAGFNVDRSTLRVAASGNAKGKFKGTFAPF